MSARISLIASKENIKYKEKYKACDEVVLTKHFYEKMFGQVKSELAMSTGRVFYQITVFNQ